MCINYSKETGSEWVGEISDVELTCDVLGGSNGNSLIEFEGNPDVALALFQAGAEALSLGYLDTKDSSIDVKARVIYSCGCEYDGYVGEISFDPDEKRFHLDAFIADFDEVGV